MTTLIASTLSELRKARSISSSCLVAYSDGKDSRAVMDMALRTFDHVEGFYMWFVPGLKFIDEGLAVAEQRYGIKIHQFPHWSAATAMKNGVYCDPARKRDDLPEIKLADLYAYAMKVTGIPLIMTGAKKADSGWRRRFIHSTKHWERIIYPLVEWTKWDVLSYLKGRNISIPNNSAGGVAGGVALVPHELLWIYDNHPDDFWRIAEFFPYVEAVVRRREFYGN